MLQKTQMEIEIWLNFSSFVEKKLLKCKIQAKRSQFRRFHGKFIAKLISKPLKI